MTLNELILDVSLVGDCGSFENIKTNGWINEEQLLEHISKFEEKDWTKYPDGRSVMIVDNPGETGGWSCKFVVLDGWVATYNYAKMEHKMKERMLKEAKSNGDHHDDDDWDDDDNEVNEDCRGRDENQD